MELGYACINLSLKDEKINRGMRKSTFEKKGLTYASELSYKNIIDLKSIIEWNENNDISCYRLSSDMFPWFSQYNIFDLPNFNLINDKLKEIGDIAKRSNQRLSFHPGPFNCLGSPNEEVVDKTINELNKHSLIMDLLGFKTDFNSKINIHVGGAYKDKEKTAERFCKNYERLNENTKKRLTLENDDKKNLYNIKDLYDLIFKKIKIPLVFDYLHHKVKNDGITEEEGFEIAYSTWRNATPTMHFSSSKKLFENQGDKSKLSHHSDYIYEKINTYNKNNIYIMLEAKAKDLALLDYRKKFN